MKRCPFCKAPKLTDAIPSRYACNRLRDIKETDKSRIHKECLEIEVRITAEL